MHTTFTIYQKEPGKFLKLSELIKGRVYYKNYYLCLVTNEKYQYSIETFFSELRNKIEFNPKRIIHLFYELDLKSLISMPENEILAIDLIYKDSLDREKEEKSPDIELNIIEKPDKTEYTQRFNYVQENLSRGNCYQVNLTQRYRYKIDSSIVDFETKFLSSSLLSEFAHMTYIPLLDKCFFSNSPEALFNLKDKGSEYIIESRPIKGTISVEEGSDIDLLWNELSTSEKNQAELYMISDLIRNDLAEIERPIARIVKNKEPLRVPGLLHQYSQIEVTTSKKITLYDIFSSLFPGGSITGAPKKRVREIIKKIESSPRNYYCSSSVFFTDNEIKASINIRSAEIDFAKNELVYGSGGGITLNSNSSDEYSEMEHKVKSFLSLFS